MLTREQATVQGFDLNSTTSRVRVSVAPGSAVSVYARPEFGTWAAATLSIKHASTSDAPAADFDTAKTIPAGGGIATMTADDMLAVREFDITVTAAEGSAATATLRIVGDVYGVTSGGGISTIAGGSKVPSISDSPSGPADGGSPITP